MSLITGTGVALVTPFKEDGAVDIAALKSLVDHVTQGGVNFLVILGTTGESATLSQEDKVAVIETILHHNNGRLPIVLGCGGNRTDLVCKDIALLSTRYEPDAFLSVCPYYNKPSQEGLYQHFKAVASSTDRAIILYNVPGRTSCNLQPETALRLAHEFENIVAIKDASGDLEQGMDLIQGAPEGFSVLSGDDTLVLAQIAVGFQGVISVAANALPQPFSQLVDTARQGDFKSARTQHYQILKLMRLFFAEGNPAGVKACLELLNVCGPTVRLPLVQASANLKDQIKSTLENATR